MKHIKKILLFSFIIVSFSLLNSCGGSFKIAQGNLDFLKGAKEFKIEYDYSNMGVGKFAKEDEYINDKVTTYNAKEAGKGDKWREAWKSARANYYQPKFEELLNTHLSEKATAYPRLSKAKYTLIVRTTFIEPGYNVYISRKNAEINVIIDIVETANPTNILASLSYNNIPGRSGDWDDFSVGSRISESYAKAGKELGKFLKKHI